MSEQGLLVMLRAINRGDFTQELAGGSEIADEANLLVSKLNRLATETTRVCRDIDGEGLFGGQIDIPDADGTWSHLVENLNSMFRAVTIDLRAVGKSVTALSNGEFGLQLTYPAQGEVQELFDTLNTMALRLGELNQEISRIACEVGVEGRFGGQAEVPGIAGGWKEMVDGVNLMARNLTDQVRDMSRSAGSIANGEATRRVTVSAKGEMGDLKDALNRLCDREAIL